jgi:hypothetical protein
MGIFINLKPQLSLRSGVDTRKKSRYSVRTERSPIGWEGGHHVPSDVIRRHFAAGLQNICRIGHEAWAFITFENGNIENVQ